MMEVKSQLGRKTRLGVVAAVMLASTIAWSTFQDRGVHENRSPSSAKSDRGKLSEDMIQLSLARRAAERGEYEAASQYIDHALELQPGSIPANLFKAELLFRLYRTDEMRPILENILRQDPDHFEAHANMAFALRFSGELDEAEKHVDWCLLRRRDFLPVLRIRAEIFRDKGDAARALAEARNILNLHPHDIESQILAAEILMYQREFESAYGYLEKQSEVAHRNPRLAALLAQVCQLLGKESEATEYRTMLNLQKQPESRSE